jgi:hypothetical protein
MFSYVRPEQRIHADHPLGKVRELAREVLGELMAMPSEQLLSALLLQPRMQILPPSQREKVNHHPFALARFSANC